MVVWGKEGILNYFADEQDQVGDGEDNIAVITA